MKKRFSKKLVSVITMMMLVLSLVGCGAKKYNIEVSENKVEVDVDDKVTIEIENYDELEDVNIEVEDDDIIKVKEKKGEITITGLEEGKTNIIITAANSDDEITIKVKVNAPAAPEPEPEPEPEPQQPEPQQPEPQQPEPQQPQQPEPQQPSGGSHTASDWFGDYHGTVYLYGSGAWSDQNLQYKCTAKVGTASGRDFFEVYSTEMDLWGGDWSGSNPVITFWVDITDDKMVCDTEVDAWVLDENDLSGESFYWYSYELDSGLTFSYDYWDPDYNGGFYVYIELYKD
ncbi:MAG: hypothetical protein K5871_09975 [Lachnospiraceae bacterium]|nr:hypothetical protein [Lachnospiraceae bacterium]